MSLNGLDTPAVRDAYEAAVSEAGGWFLLKYSSRDEIELHSHGSSGVVEMRTAISKYEDASPLYGMLRYRRRRVIIKYLPNNCSRLMQARVAVHFNAVSEKFSPHNATFTISTANDLKDAKLSAACSLHTASSSTSSSTSSLRRRRLIEIAEEEEEEQQSTKRQSTLREESSPDDGSLPSSPVVLNSKLAYSPEASQFSTSNDPPLFLGSEHSCNTHSKPQVKVGPRPSVERPRTSAGTGTSRPVSSIPVGLKLLSRGSFRERDNRREIAMKEPLERPQMGEAGSAAFPTEIPSIHGNVDADTMQVPETMAFVAATRESIEIKQLVFYTDRPNTSSGVSVKSTSTSAKRSTITPEMIRLKKAMKLREEKKNAIDQLSFRSADIAVVSNHRSFKYSSDIVDLPQSMLSSNSCIADSLSKTPSFNSDHSVDQLIISKGNFADSAISVEDLALNHTSANTLTSTISHSGTSLADLSKDFDSAKILLSDSTNNASNTIHRCGDISVQDVRNDIRRDNLTEQLEYPILSSLLPIISELELREDRQTIYCKDSASMVDVTEAGRKAALELSSIDVNCKLERQVTSSDTHLSEDEDLMDELQSASVQEAQPVVVSKSPMTPVFPSTTPLKQPQPLQVIDDDLVNHALRTTSNPVHGTLLVSKEARPGSARSLSSGVISPGTMFMPKQTQQLPSNLASKKTSIGSSISQRIKALEKLSVGTRTTTLDVPTRPESSTFFSVRKTSGRELQVSQVLGDQNASLVRAVYPELQTKMPKLELHRDRSGSVASRLSVFESECVPTRRESVQVKARILRDPAQLFPKMFEGHRDSAEFSPLNLAQSPLVVDHQKAIPIASSVYASDSTPEVVDTNSNGGSIQERRMSREKRSQSHGESISDDVNGIETPRARRRSSLSILKDFIKDSRESVVIGGWSPSVDNPKCPTSAVSLPTPSKSPSRPPSVHTTSGLARRLSISSRRSSVSKDKDSNYMNGVPLSPSLMTEASGSGDESRPSTSDYAPKTSGPGSGKSRAGRFIRRLSSSFSSGRRTIPPTISPTVAEEEETYNIIPMSRGNTNVFQPPSIVSYMGDVNVQFPENLLWKRRTMCLDSQGFLILSTIHGVAATATLTFTLGNDHTAGSMKRYHMSDFRPPYIPEMEIQELPNSVCLDFVDGSGLQIACEDRLSQADVLRILQAAHQSHAIINF